MCGSPALADLIGDRTAVFGKTDVAQHPFDFVNGVELAINDIPLQERGAQKFGKKEGPRVRLRSEHQKIGQTFPKPAEQKRALARLGALQYGQDAVWRKPMTYRPGDELSVLENRGPVVSRSEPVEKVVDAVDHLETRRHFSQCCRKADLAAINAPSANRDG